MSLTNLISVYHILFTLKDLIQINDTPFMTKDLKNEKKEEKILDPTKLLKRFYVQLFILGLDTKVMLD